MERFILPFSAIVKQPERPYLREALGLAGTCTVIPYRQDEGVGEGAEKTGGKLSQGQVTLMTAVRSGDCGDRGASGYNASKGV